MKRLINIEDTTANKITYLHLLIFITSLPFDRFYSELILVSLFIHSCIQLTKKKFQNIPWKAVLVMQSVYLITMAGSLYSEHKSIAFGLWEKQLAIVLFPLIFFLNPIDLKKYTRHLLYSFSIVNVLVILYLYYDAFAIIRYYKMPPGSIFSGLFFSHKFSAPLDMHATYLSLYCALSLVTTLSFFFTNTRTAWQKLPAVLATIILCLGMVQLGSRSVIAGLMVVVLFIFPYFIQQNRARKFFVSMSILIAITIGTGIYISDHLNYRFIKSLKTDLAIDRESLSLSDPRAERWKLAWELIKERPLFGFGTGEEVPLLKEKYFANKLYDSYLHELNAHNQYLSFMIKGGMAALAVFLFTLTFFFKMAIRRRNLYFAAFLVLLVIVCFSENVLNVNKGIFFYAFFLSFFAAGEIKQIQKTAIKRMAGNPGERKNVFTGKALTV